MKLYEIAKQIAAGQPPATETWRSQHPAPLAQQPEFIVDQSQLLLSVIGGEATQPPVEAAEADITLEDQTRHVLGATAISGENQPGE